MRSQEEKIFAGLNQPQAEAVRATNGPVLIIAGAGSGKTKTLTHKVAYLISQGISPKAIVALTFTNKAAQEMSQRIKQLVQPLQNLPFIGTFHKFALMILHRDSALIGYPSGFSIYDETDSNAVMQQVLEDLGDHSNPRAIYKKLSFLKNRGDTLKNIEQPQKLQTIYEAYEQALHNQNAFDFDNIILKALELLQQNPKILQKYQAHQTHFLIDEYQDTNKPQYELLRLLVGENNNICVVGDDWQSIYGFRSADYRILLNFERDWPKANVFYLEQNYRSSQNILDASHGVISKNIARTEKKLFTNNPTGKPVTITQFTDEQQEALWIKQALFEKINQGVPLSEIAILFRTNVQSRLFEDMCIEEQLPYQLIGAFKFYKRKEILDLIAYLRVVHNPKDSPALERIINTPPRGIGAISINRLKQEGWDWQHLPPSSSRDRLQKIFALLETLRAKAPQLTLPELIELVINLIDYKAYLDPNTDEGQERWENIQELKRIAEAFNHSGKSELAEFLQTIQLMQAADEFEKNAPKLTLMTLHSAKGLEFDTVFVSGLEEGLLPHSRSLMIPDQLEEERRLLYVGMTRAKTQLHLTLCQTRFIHGSMQYNIPSRFLHDIPEQYAQFTYQNSSLLSEERDGLLYEYNKSRNEDDEDIILLG